MIEAKKFVVNFDGKSLERIDKWSTDNASRAEFIRQAISLEDLYRTTINKGGRFIVENADRTLVEIIRPPYYQKPE